MKREKITVEDLLCSMPRFGLVDGNLAHLDTDDIEVNFYTSKFDAINRKNKLCLSFSSVFNREDLMKLKVIAFWPENNDLNIIVDGVWNNHLITEEIEYAGRK